MEEGGDADDTVGWERVSNRRAWRLACSAPRVLRNCVFGVCAEGHGGGGDAGEHKTSLFISIPFTVYSYCYTVRFELHPKESPTNIAGRTCTVCETCAFVGDYGGISEQFSYFIQMFSSRSWLSFLTTFLYTLSKCFRHDHGLTTRGSVNGAMCLDLERGDIYIAEILKHLYQL